VQSLRESISTGPKEKIEMLATCPHTLHRANASRKDLKETEKDREFHE